MKLHDKYLEEKQLSSEKRKLEKFEKQKAKKIESTKTEVLYKCLYPLILFSYESYYMSHISTLNFRLKGRKAM